MKCSGNTIALLPLLAGSCLPLQAAIMLVLRRILGSTLWVLVWNYVGLTVLTIPACFWGRSWRESFEALKEKVRADWRDAFSLLPGVVGPMVVFSTIFVSGNVGLGTSFVFSVCGSVVASLLLDFTGALWAERKPVSALRIGGAVLILGGTGAFQADSMMDSRTSAGGLILFLVLGVTAGGLFVVQAAMNKRLTQTFANPCRAAALTGLQGMAVTVPIALALDPLPDFSRARGVDFWAFLSGSVGLLMVISSMTAPRFVGFSVTFQLTVLGQVVAAVVYDRYLSVFGLESRDVTLARGVGLVLVLLGMLTSLLEVWREGRKEKQKKEVGKGELEGEKGIDRDRESDHVRSKRCEKVLMIEAQDVEAALPLSESDEREGPLEDSGKKETGAAGEREMGRLEVNSRAFVTEFEQKIPMRERERETTRPLSMSVSCTSVPPFAGSGSLLTVKEKDLSWVSRQREGDQEAPGEGEADTEKKGEENEV
uniref:EamA domain-containing protein n=1 Tax=Chromera velia CCMP2878 TaxID=1169474 RepID=A0A0G4I7R9_9ALVE|eukprot:Cvel_1947.t1-p1 / transcript=Cvel_1947.t1 / gene=Cvel_1947 / organism=Chromera_velia_CCMP2878 / gene_product=hypothetical protein / transcript_product=hypothetical protein / location=Cvel_scaffold73:136446-138649(-) / protein_length=482 / sequence_SO=supercontig / SO=protein_coding / is_pseudo=false